MLLRRKIEKSSSNRSYFFGGRVVSIQFFVVSQCNKVRKGDEAGQGNEVLRWSRPTEAVEAYSCVPGMVRPLNTPES